MMKKYFLLIFYVKERLESLSAKLKLSLYVPRQYGDIKRYAYPDSIGTAFTLD